MQLLKTFIQKYWALMIMIMIGVIAVFAVVGPGWFQSYQFIVWSIAFLISVILWSMRKQNKE